MLCPSSALCPPASLGQGSLLVAARGTGRLRVAALPGRAARPPGSHQRTGVAGAAACPSCKPRLPCIARLLPCIPSQRACVPFIWACRLARQRWAAPSPPASCQSRGAMPAAKERQGNFGRAVAAAAAASRLGSCRQGARSAGSRVAAAVPLPALHLSWRQPSYNPPPPRPPISLGCSLDSHERASAAGEPSLKEETELVQNWTPSTATVAVTFKEKQTGRRHILKAPVLPSFASYFPRLRMWARQHLGWQHVSGNPDPRSTATAFLSPAEQACQLVGFLISLERPPDGKVAREGGACAGRLLETNSV